MPHAFMRMLATGMSLLCYYALRSSLPFLVPVPSLTLEALDLHEANKSEISL